MASPELIILWAKITADLQRARSTLPAQARAAPSVREYEDYLDHNELELACDMLESYAETHPVTRDFWLALRDASVKMELVDRASRYESLAAAK